MYTIAIYYIYHSYILYINIDYIYTTAIYCTIYTLYVLYVHTLSIYIYIDIYYAYSRHIIHTYIDISICMHTYTYICMHTSSCDCICCYIYRCPLPPYTHIDTHIYLKLRVHLVALLLLAADLRLAVSLELIEVISEPV